MKFVLSKQKNLGHHPRLKKLKAWYNNSFRFSHPVIIDSQVALGNSDLGRQMFSCSQNTSPLIQEPPHTDTQCVLDSQILIHHRMAHQVNSFWLKQACIFTAEVNITFSSKYPSTLALKVMLSEDVCAPSHSHLLQPREKGKLCPWGKCIQTGKAITPSLRKQIHTSQHRQTWSCQCFTAREMGLCTHSQGLMSPGAVSELLFFLFFRPCSRHTMNITTIKKKKTEIFLLPGLDTGC